MTVGQLSEMSALPIRAPTKPFANIGFWLGLREFIVRIPTNYLPTMGKLNYFLLVQQCFKVVGPALTHYWHANPPFTNGFNNLPMMAQLSELLGQEITSLLSALSNSGKNAENREMDTLQ